MEFAFPHRRKVRDYGLAEVSSRIGSLKRQVTISLPAHHGKRETSFLKRDAMSK